MVGSIGNCTLAGRMPALPGFFSGIVKKWMRERRPMKRKIAVDDLTYKLAKEYASKNSLSIEQAASKLICKGLGFRIVNGLLVFDLPDGTPTVTNEMVKALESELEIEPDEGLAT